MSSTRRNRIRLGVAGVAVMLSMLASAQVAGAAGWAIQPTANITPPPNPGVTTFEGVSCGSATACAAAGYNSIGSSDDALSEVWNGSSWTVPFLVKGDPLRSANSSFLHAVSCGTATKCEMVGEYFNPAGLPLALLWSGALGRFSVASQPMQVPGGAVYTEVDGVSCTSATACTAVGVYNIAAGARPLAERWDGTRWTIQPTPFPSGAIHASLNAVSCPSATDCVAVGQVVYGTTANAFAERWDGSSWSFEFPQNKSRYNDLFGVSCSSPTACVAVGQYSDQLSGAPRTLGEFSPGLASWRLETTPDLSATFNTLRGVSCASATSCQAVGQWQDFRGNYLTLAVEWDGFAWSYESTPNPAAPIAGLRGVSCTSATACTAVGSYCIPTVPTCNVAKGTTLTLAERFSGATGPHGFSADCKRRRDRAAAQAAAARVGRALARSAGPPARRGCARPPSGRTVDDQVGPSRQRPSTARRQLHRRVGVAA